MVNTIMVNKGFKKLQNIPNTDLRYFILISRLISSLRRYLYFEKLTMNLCSNFLVTSMLCLNLPNDKQFINN